MLHSLISILKPQTEGCFIFIQQMCLRLANYLNQCLHFVSEQELDTGQTDAEDVKYILVTKHLSWRRSFTSTAT